MKNQGSYVNMLEKYKVVYKGGQDEIIEKKSRFIATVAPVESEEEALAFIEAMKKKYCVCHRRERTACKMQ